MAQQDTAPSSQLPQHPPQPNSSPPASFAGSPTSVAFSSDKGTEQWTNSSDSGSDRTEDFKLGDKSAQLLSRAETTSGKEGVSTSRSRRRCGAVEAILLCFVLAVFLLEIYERVSRFVSALPFTFVSFLPPAVFPRTDLLSSRTQRNAFQCGRRAECMQFDIFYPQSQTKDERFRLVAANAARTASIRAQQALSVFTRLNELSDPRTGTGAMSLHPVECWEMANIIDYSRGLEDYKGLVNQLNGLGNLVRDVKEDVINLGAQGWASMNLIVHEFDVLEKLLTRISSATKLDDSTKVDLELRLNAYFDCIDDSIQDLLVSLDKALPTASRGVHAASGVHRSLGWSGHLRESGWDEVGGLAKFFDWAFGGHEATRVRKDLALVATSMSSVHKVWMGMEDTRVALHEYATRAGQFKAALIGRHLADHGLSPQDELASFSGMMDEMRRVVQGGTAESSNGGWMELDG
ncbi:hypothetical protein JCM6882_006914 [Rhodosporidiobolus microsporus]